MSDENNTERKPLRMRTTEEPETFVRIDTPATEEVKTAYRPIQKSDSKPLVPNSVIALALTLAMIGGGYVSYKMITDRTARIAETEKAAREASSAREAALRLIPEMKSKIEFNGRGVKNELARADREAKARIEKEEGEETNALRIKLERAKVELAGAGRTAGANADTVTRGLTARLNEIHVTAEGLYDKNREMKLWLNANKRTMHGTYEIGPRP